MKRFSKWLFLLVVAAVAFATYSYAGAWFTAGRVVGSSGPVSDRTMEFAFKGVPDLPGNPRAWIVTYHRTQLPGVRRVQIYVSPTGRLIATRPGDLDARLDAWEKAKQP
jgi:hypothetical protein